MSGGLPTVTFIIPTLNAAGLLPFCLRAIRAQDYPRDHLQILVVDGGSSDATLEIARQFGAQVIANPDRVAEQGKRIAMPHVRGEIVIFVDADNEITHPDFVRRAVGALSAHPDALGVESYYLASPRMSSLCVYLTQTLHIGDPVAWIMSVPPVLLESEAGVETWTFPAGSLAYPLGANGFVYRRDVLVAAQAEQDFEDTHIALRIALAGRRQWLRLSGRGVHHYLVTSLGDFVKKRRRQTFHFLGRRGKKGDSWTRMNPRVPAWLACLYCVSLLGPLYHTVRGLVRTRDIRWLWHPLACLASVFGLTWGVVTYLTSARSADAEASLQPVQKLDR